MYVSKEQFSQGVHMSIAKTAKLEPEKTAKKEELSPEAKIEKLKKFLGVSPHLGLYEVKGKEITLEADTKEEFLILKEFSLNPNWVSRSVKNVALDTGFSEEKVIEVAEKYRKKGILISSINGNINTSCAISPISSYSHLLHESRKNEPKTPKNEIPGFDGCPSY